MQHSAAPLSLEAAKQVIDTQLEVFFTERLEEASGIHHRYAQLWQSLRSLMVAGGKRLRPYMLLGASSPYTNQNATTVLPAAVAQDLLHMAMLIHDDIIDIPKAEALELIR